MSTYLPTPEAEEVVHDLHVHHHPVEDPVAAPPRRASMAWVWVPLAAIALILLVDGTGLGRQDSVSGATVVFVSIAVGALPFVLVGALVSGALAALVPDRAFERLGRLPMVLQVPGAALSGFAFPVCECGSVPVARRLVARGVQPAAAVSFMLAAPILNPVVLASTAIAFSGKDALAMTAGRGLLGLVVALVCGIVLARFARLSDRFAARLACDVPAGGHEHHDHDDGHAHDGHDHSPTAGWRAKGRSVVDHTTEDLLFMGRFVVAGAALAALVQTLVPTSVLTGLSDSALLGPLVLMLVAFVLSLCSEADAFVAASFSQFSPTSQLAFLVFGPLLDLKLGLLYGATFGRRFVAGIALLGIPLVLLLSVTYGALAL